MEVCRDTALAAPGTEDLLQQTLILVDKSSFRFTSYPWVDTS